MQIEVALAPDSATSTHRAVLRLRGEFESVASAAFSERVDQLLADGHTDLVVGMRRVDYINSTALGALVRARQATIALGGSLTVARPSDIVTQLIRSVGLDAVLPMVQHEEPFSAHNPILQPIEGSEAQATVSAIVVFGFSDDRTSMFRGRLRNGVGSVLEFDTESMLFAWNPTKHELAPDELHTMFDPGSAIHLRFGIKLARRDRFQLDGLVDSWTTSETGLIQVRVLWRNMPDETRRVMQRFERDMDELRERLSAGE